MQPDIGRGSDPIRVWVLDDNDAYRETVMGFVEEDPGLECPHAFASGEEVLDFARLNPHPHVLLVDLQLPGIGGIDVIRQLTLAGSTTRFIVLTAYKDVDLIFEAVCAGASAYLLKNPSRSIRDLGPDRPTPDRVIRQAIRDVQAGGAAMTAEVGALVLDWVKRREGPGRDYGLTSKEKEVLKLLASPEDMSKKAIAKKLHKSVHTVDSQTRTIFDKLGVRSTAAAVAKAWRDGIVGR